MLRYSRLGTFVPPFLLLRASIMDRRGIHCPLIRKLLVLFVALVVSVLFAASTAQAQACESVWSSTQVHTYGDFKGTVTNVDLTMKTSGQETTMALAKPFEEYVLKGQMSGNIFTFDIFSSKGHHGKGQFTFSGDSFDGTWSDNWKKGGTWRGQRISGSSALPCAGASSGDESNASRSNACLKYSGDLQRLQSSEIGRASCRERV